MTRKISGFSIALFGIGCFVYSLYFLWQEVLLDVTGRATTGVVTAKTMEEDDDHHTHPYLAYRYEDGYGQEHTSRSDCFQSMYESHVVGGPIPVVYSSTLPNISRIRAAGESLWLVGILAALGGVSLWYGLRMLLRQIHWENKLARLKKTGERVIGRLVAVKEDTAETSEDPPKVLVYAFTDKTGQERTGETLHVSVRDYGFWESRIGDALDVRVNPADPTDHVALVEESKLLG